MASKISDDTVDAMLTLENKPFAKHGGFDATQWR